MRKKDQEQFSHVKTREYSLGLRLMKIGAALFFIFSLASVYLNADEAMGNKVFSSLTNKERQDILDLLKILKIQFADERIHGEDKMIWDSYDMVLGSSSEYPVEFLALSRALNDAVTFFPQEYWRTRPQKLKIYPIVFLGKGNEQDYLYNGNETEDRLLLNLWEVNNALVTEKAVREENIHGNEASREERVERMVSHFIHILFARNADRASHLVEVLSKRATDAYGKARTVEPYGSINDVASLLTNRKSKFTDEEVAAICQFMDEATGSKQGTYRLLYQNIKITNKAVSEIEIAKDTFGYKELREK